MAVELPDEVRAVVDAIERGDTDAFVTAFAEDGAVEDHGRRFVGHDRIRAWSDGEAIGAQARMTPTALTTHGEGVVTVQATWASEVFNGESAFGFTYADGRVTELAIPSPHA